ncbi:ABC transporter ATP-binding protein [Paraburkholderia caballeronis]|uniref:Iron(III) transport system ATP-binding protein n=1 Tax=Paraburkholderia caballeronis TaxID=416943 RepID=A0A1H7MSP2_9BURK|nr:ATP-binding cassette domain-containing protein [Paraburkholderia caballeronis]PXW26435.1 iron(III) transport system ATP-binding protein [Paraburkholderia caballeronis]PXX01982.1 iron(III) transport system ATP-binding protein [Paraburkholderia caballeronis]RAK01139.1 iron(III) transport system ATP-binding protein [Paraburkholderia caballeronis]SEB95821.1 iron(III) transport system ATP-binding protein [Paraburkholderia caballeronis]SEL14310.1 iron(III) transport system ATP-binding protein [Pa
MHLSVTDLLKTFSGHVALERIDFDVNQDEFVCLLGPSGCGKTTLLRIIAGLLDADGGRITMGSQSLLDVPARERGFGIVFQSYSLFPNMTVTQNIGYGMKIRGLSKAHIDARCNELLELIRLPQLAKRYPGQLSGGQQQRVAIARALAVDPSLLLLDEPLSALDAQVRVEMRREIHDVQRRLRIPTIMVTHDQEEALTLADKIICMNHGRIEQIGAPRDLYESPRTRFVARFIGTSNLLPAGWVCDAFPALMATYPGDPDTTFEACVRPEDLVVTRRAAADRREDDARVVDAMFLGSTTRLRLDWRGQELVAEQHRGDVLAPGTAVSLSVASDRCAWVSA